MPINETITAIERQIETLAMQVVLGAPESWQASILALQQIHQQASEAGCPELETISADLLKAVGDPATSDSHHIERALTAGVTRLQDAVATSGAEAARCAASEPTSNPSATNALADDPELVADFIQEAREHLTSIETQVLALEQNPANTEAIHSTFRSFHTIKGLAGFLDFTQMREVSHQVENLLDLARNEKLAITPAVIDVILASADHLGQSITQIEHSQSTHIPPVFPDSATLQQAIERAMKGEAPPTPDAAPALADEETSISAPAQAAPQAAKESASVRVETGKLDYLVDMVGELVIAQSMVRHDPDLSAATGSRLQRNLTQLARITSEVQKTTMSMRMVPVGNLFQRMTRLVRDLSRKNGKLVELETSGEDTDLDKTIIEELADPLMHMVRNSLDHGIETPEQRTASGKPPTGRIALRAYHQAAQILIDVCDDGRGLDREKILRKAVQNSLVSADAQLSDSDVFNLIFAAGLSTAEKVTDISGRGVGMDVVRRQIQKLRGRVDIESQLGRGTTFHLRLPLTLAIIEGLVVGVGTERYIAPISVVHEMLRPTPEMLSSVEGRSEMAMVRNRLLPLVRLHQRFGIQPRSTNPCEGLVLVTESEGKHFCLLVDEFIGKQEVVIKSLGDTLKATEGITGGAILGDGRVGLILDMDGVFGARHHA